jgi:ubiquinone/menaquinone biosynthesis C-methylase UbiE
MPLDWHLRYLRQANWTSQIREYLYRKSNVELAKIVLEVGCGTGAILHDQAFSSDTTRVGLDINQANLQKARGWLKDPIYIHGDGHFLPFADQSFDITFCHFLLLWATHPRKIIEEMKRVTRSGGFVLAMAEPDYDGRIDHPETFVKLGILQKESLLAQGAKPDMGRNLRGLFSSVGLNKIEVGVLGGQWNESLAEEEWEMEWEVLKSDLSEYAPKEWIEELQQEDFNSWLKQERILFVPMFYAFGQVPSQ